jgi:hypothetical protein
VRFAGVDLDHPGISLHWNLMEVTPCGPGPDAELDALHTALTERVPLLGACLIQWGLLTPSNGAGWTLLLDGARALLCAHHRRRLEGTAGPDDLPSLLTLLTLLTNSATLPELVERELVAWNASAVDGVLPVVGADGAAIVSMVQDTLAEMGTRVLTLGLAERRQRGAELVDRLAPVLEVPYLRPWWGAPLVAPGPLLNGAPPCLDVYLPLVGPNEAQAVAVRRYGYYLLACIIAAAQERIASAQTYPPLLLVLREGAGWWAGSLLHIHGAELAQAGIAVLTTCSQLPNGPPGSYLLAETATWWVHSLVPADAQLLAQQFSAWGVQVDLPLTRLPPGTAVLKTRNAYGYPLVATVDTRNLCPPCPSA